MARRGSGAWEIRESRSTPRGPRSRTLATFRELTPEIVERACARASGEVDPEGLRRAALRAGAPVAVPAPDRLAEGLLGEFAAGRAPRPALARLLRDRLDADNAPLSDPARSVAAWIGASATQRGEALLDLLLLTDRLPARRRGGLRFPPLGSAGS